MTLQDQARALADAMRASEEAREYRALKEEVYQDETNATLLKEYKRLQLALQRGVIAGGGQPAAEDTDRFQKVSALLMLNPRVQAFLISEMRMMRLFAELTGILAQAAGVDVGEWLN